MLASFLYLSLSSCLSAPLAVQDDAEERYAFLTGLYDKQLYEMVVQEGENFLKLHPQHARGDLVRYRLASAQFELHLHADALPHFRGLAAREGFEFRAESALRRGQCALELEQLDEAAQAFDQLTRLPAGYLTVPALYLLAETHFRAADFAAAEQAYAKAAAADVQGEYARECAYGLAWCAFRLGRPDPTVARAEDFLKRFAGDPLAAEMSFLAGEAHYQAGRPAPALAAYRQVNGGQFHAAALRGAGFAAAALGDARQAAQWFGRLVELHPGSPHAAEAQLQRGVQLLQAGDAAAAAAALAQCSEKDQPEILYWRGRAAAALGEQEQALAFLDQAHRALGGAEGELAERVAVARGDLLAALGRFAEARDVYQTSGSDYALHAAAVAALNEGRHQEAAELARRFLDDYATSDYRLLMHTVLGEALLALHDYPAAQEAFAAALAAGAAGEQAARAASRLAWCHFLQGAWREAARLFAAVHQQHPGDPLAAEALFMEGRSREEAKEPAAAHLAWRAYLERHPRGEHRAEALLRLSRGVEPAAAVAHLERLIEEFPEDATTAQALYELAELRYAQGQAPQAVADYALLLQRFPESSYAGPARYGLAWALYQGKDYPRAAQELRVLGADQKQDAALRCSAWELLIWCESQAGRPRPAAAAFRSFAELCGEERRRYDAGMTVVRSLRDGGEPAEAGKLLESLAGLVTDPALQAAVAVEQAYLALKLERIEDAEARARAAHRLAPGSASAEALFFVAEAHYQRQRDQAAEALYELAARQEGSPVADRALYKRGFALLRLERLAEAAAAFQALAAQFPKSELCGESLFLVGETRYRLGDYAAAVAPLEQLGRQFREHEVADQALFRLGLSHGRLGNWPQAEQALNELLRRYPAFSNLAEAELWRGRALAATGKARVARQAFERAVAGDRGSCAAQARLEIGRLHWSGGETEQALSEFLKVALLYSGPEVAEGLYCAGQCLEKLGDPRRAREQYQEIVSSHAATPFAAQARERLQQLAAQPTQPSRP